MNIKKKGDSIMTNEGVTTDVIEAIKRALEKIDEKYCRLSLIDYGKIATEIGIEKDVEDIKKQKYLERPFAYEFYHQLRKLMESGEVKFGGPIVQAEVSKAYQRVFEKPRITPDFLIHVPDARLKNLAVIEFKLATNLTKIEHDFEKLVDFKKNVKVKYRYAIEVVIGNTESLKKAKPLIDKWDNHEGEEIIIIDFNTDPPKKANDRIIHYTHSENLKRI